MRMDMIAINLRTFYLWSTYRRWMAFWLILYYPTDLLLFSSTRESTVLPSPYTFFPPKTDTLVASCNYSPSVVTVSLLLSSLSLSLLPLFSIPTDCRSVLGWCHVRGFFIGFSWCSSFHRFSSLFSWWYDRAMPLGFTFASPWCELFLSLTLRLVTVMCVCTYRFACSRFITIDADLLSLLRVTFYFGCFLNLLRCPFSFLVRVFFFWVFQLVVHWFVSVLFWVTNFCGLNLSILCLFIAQTFCPMEKSLILIWLDSIPE